MSKRSRRALTRKEEWRAFTKPKFKDLFDVDENSGAYLYRTDSCCDRYKNCTRDEMGDYGESISEGKKSIVGPYGNLEYQRELFNIACCYALKRTFDLSPDPKMDLDKWVSNYKHLLSDEMIEKKDIFDRVKERDKIHIRYAEEMDEEEDADNTGA